MLSETQQRTLELPLGVGWIVESIFVSISMEEVTSADSLLQLYQRQKMFMSCRIIGVLL